MAEDSTSAAPTLDQFMAEPKQELQSRVEAWLKNITPPSTDSDSMGIGEESSDLDFRVERCRHRGEILLREASAYLNEPISTRAPDLDMDRVERRKLFAAQITAKITKKMQQDSDMAYEKSMALLERQQVQEMPLSSFPITPYKRKQL